MSERVSRFVTVNGIEIHYSEWGRHHEKTVFCLHGLTRNGRDFDVIAKALSDEYRVICPDVIGRGFSQWAEHPEHEYCFDNYVSMLTALVETVSPGDIDWIGTSMGGALGIRLAGSHLHGRVRHLVLNDIGPGPLEEAQAATETMMEAVQRITAYLSKPPKYKTFSELLQYYKAIYKTLSAMSDEEWVELARNSARRTDDGYFTPDYDPHLAVQMTRPEDLHLWDYFSQVDCPIFTLRGEHSDVLPLDVANRMISSKANCEMMTINGCGHAPSLNTSDQIDSIRAFLRR